MRSVLPPTVPGSMQSIFSVKALHGLVWGLRLQVSDRTRPAFQSAKCLAAQDCSRLASLEEAAERLAMPKQCIGFHPAWVLFRICKMLWHVLGETACTSLTLYLAR